MTIRVQKQKQDTGLVGSGKMKLIFENWKRFINENKEVPDHFGGGENIDIFGYKTEHFDICQSAVILYKRLVKDVDNTDAQDLIISSAKKLDHLFEM